MKYCQLFISFFFLLNASAQTNEANLGFEEKEIYNDIAPWYRTYFSKQKNYRVELDSLVTHSGCYSLRFVYDTIRTGAFDTHSDGLVASSVPVDVIGKRIKVSGYVKQSNSLDTAGSISFIVSNDKGERKIAVKGHAITGAKEWKEYGVEFNLDTFNLPLHHLRITAAAGTKDTLWIDDFKIQVDGKDLYNIPSFASSKGEIISRLSEMETRNLKMLCYVWGFLKYFHPVVASGKYNWDMELFKIIPGIKKAENDVQLSAILSDWINTLGEIPACKKCSAQIPENSFSYNVDLQWMNDKSISQTLRQQLKYILANRHMGDGYYVRYEPVRNLFFDHENEYNWREKNYPNDLFRLQFLFRHWNTIQYFYPYKNIIGKDWNSLLQEFIPQVAEAKDSVDYHIAINQFVNSINDSHSGNYDMILAKEFGYRYLPVLTTMVNDTAVVSGFYNDSLAKANGLQIGDAITRINHNTIKQIIDERISLVNGSNYTRKISTLLWWNFITGGKDSVIDLDFVRDHKSYHSKVSRYIYSNLKSEYKQYEYKQDKTKWKVLKDNVGFINMGNLEKSDIDSMMMKLKDTKAIIFDIRNYPKDTYVRLCEYLKDEATAFAQVTYPDLSYPGNFLWGTNKIKCGPNSSTKGTFHYNGKIIMLVNELTQSHAEWTTMAFQSVPGAVTVGSQTSGADGNVSTLYLTGNYFTYMTGLGIFYPDGTPTQRKGVKIDVEVKPSTQGIKEGRDEVLEKAISIINN